MENEIQDLKKREAARIHAEKLEQAKLLQQAATEAGMMASGAVDLMDVDRRAPEQEQIAQFIAQCN